MSLRNQTTQISLELCCMIGLSHCSTLFRLGLLKVNRIFRSAPSSHFRCMSNEAFQLYFFGKLSLTFAYLSENPESLIIWKFEKKKLKKKKKNLKIFFLKIFFSNFFFNFFFSFVVWFFLTNYLVFDVWSQTFQFLTIKPMNLFDTNKE